jgi:hypothetical protein
MTLADHAEAWWREMGKEVPSRGTNRWRQMYKQWVESAFADLHETDSDCHLSARKGKQSQYCTVMPSVNPSPHDAVE